MDQREERRCVDYRETSVEEWRSSDPECSVGSEWAAAAVVVEEAAATRSDWATAAAVVVAEAAATR